MSNSATEKVGQPLWQDRAAQVSLGLAILLNLILFLVVFLAHQQLNEAVTAGSVAAGGISGAVDPAPAPNAGAPFNVLILPIIGLVSWIVGGALGAYYYSPRTDAPMAYIVWAAVALIGLATWVPVLSLILKL
jgi:hypothetical protein